MTDLATAVPVFRLRRPFDLDRLDDHVSWCLQMSETPLPLRAKAALALRIWALYPRVLAGLRREQLPRSSPASAGRAAPARRTPPRGSRTRSTGASGWARAGRAAS